MSRPGSVPDSAPAAGEALKAARVELCHDWLITFGGSEVVTAELARILKPSRVLTFAMRSDAVGDQFGDVPVEQTSMGATKFAQRHWHWLLPVMPMSWRRFDVSDADLVVTSSYASVNSIRSWPRHVRVSYCHTPMRYAWRWRAELKRFPPVVRPAWPLIAAWLRWRDKRWSTRVDEYVANSRFTADSIKSAYGRDAAVVHPPVDVEFFHPDPSVERDEYFLLAGRLVAYKRPDLAVRAANETGCRLVVAGGGPMLEELVAMAGPTVEFVRDPTNEELRDLYRRAGAIVYPQVEEFGITLVEAAACGTPALALAAGGALDTVVPGETGMLYSEQRELAAAMGEFDFGSWDYQAIAEHAQRFSRVRFADEMRDVFAKAMRAHSAHPDRELFASQLRAVT